MRSARARPVAKPMLRALTRLRLGTDASARDRAKARRRPVAAPAREHVAFGFSTSKIQIDRRVDWPLGRARQDERRSAARQGCGRLVTAQSGFDAGPSASSRDPRPRSCFDFQRERIADSARLDIRSESRRRRAAGHVRSAFVAAARTCPPRPAQRVRNARSHAECVGHRLRAPAAIPRPKLSTLSAPRPAAPPSAPICPTIPTSIAACVRRRSTPPGTPR